MLPRARRLVRRALKHFNIKFNLLNTLTSSFLSHLFQHFLNYLTSKLDGYIDFCKWFWDFQSSPFFCHVVKGLKFSTLLGVPLIARRFLARYRVFLGPFGPPGGFGIFPLILRGFCWKISLSFGGGPSWGPLKKGVKYWPPLCLGFQGLSPKDSFPRGENMPSRAYTRAPGGSRTLLFHGL